MIDWNNDLVSVIIPVYNAEKYIYRCIKSIINQTYKNIEIIIINDGSTDHSLEKIEELIRIDKRIRVISQENKGISETRNQGIKHATGKFIVFVDSDDWIDLNTIELAVANQTENNSDIVMWSYKREYNNISKDTFVCGEEKQVWKNDEVKVLHRRLIGLIGDELSEPNKIDSMVTVWGKLYTKEIVKDTKFIDIKVIGNEDALFNIYVFGKAKIVSYIPDRLYHYRKEDINSLTHLYKKNLVYQWKTLYGLMIKYIKDNSLPEYYMEALENRACLGLIGLGLNIAEDKGLSFIDKYKELKKILKMKHYRIALSHLDIRCMPVHWKVFFICAKNQWIFITCLLLNIMVYLRGK